MLTIPVLLFHFFLLFPEKSRFLSRYPLSRLLIYVIPVFISSFLFFSPRRSSSYAMADLPEELYVVFYLYLLINIVLGIWLFFYNYRHTTEEGSRMQLKWILWGFVFCLISFFVLFNLEPPEDWWSLFSFQMVDFGASRFEILKAISHLSFFISMVLLPFTFLFSIFKYRLMDIDIVIKKSVVYAVSGLLLLFFFDRLNTLTLDLFSDTALQKSGVPQLFIALMTTALFSPVTRRMQILVEKRFYPERYLAKHTLLEISQQLRHTPDLQHVSRLLVERVTTDMRLSSGVLLLYSHKHGQYLPVEYEGYNQQLLETLSFTDSDDLIRQLKQAQRALSIQMRPNMDDRLKQPGARICIPFFAQQHLIGLMLLGPKQSRDLYTTEDLQLLDTVAENASLALENAILNQEVMHSAELHHELSIAAQIQRELLPQRIPTIPGFDLDGFSRPARQVGGDLYDFIVVESTPRPPSKGEQPNLNPSREGNSKLGIVIGDVSGKSVSAAMVMAISQGVVQMAAKYSPSPAQILSSVNNLLCTRIGRNRFVALCYAQIDPITLQMSYTLAGLPRPVLIHEGQPGLLDMCEQRLPLGQLRHIVFDQKSVQLAPGDTLIFYSDGLDETINPTGEMYGTARLMNVLADLNGSSAMAIRQRILDDITAFANETEQFDDLTVVVVKIQT